MGRCCAINKGNKERCAKTATINGLCAIHNKIAVGYSQDSECIDFSKREYIPNETKTEKCCGLTNNGERCKNNVIHDSMFCTTHPIEKNGVYEGCNIPNMPSKTSVPKSEIPKNQCCALTQQNKQCNNASLEGKKYCRTHRDYDGTDSCSNVPKGHKLVRHSPKLATPPKVVTHTKLATPPKLSTPPKLVTSPEQVSKQCCAEKTNGIKCTYTRSKNSQYYCDFHMKNSDRIIRNICLSNDNTKDEDEDLNQEEDDETYDTYEQNHKDYCYPFNKKDCSKEYCEYYNRTCVQNIKNRKQFVHRRLYKKKYE